MKAFLCKAVISCLLLSLSFFTPFAYSEEGWEEVFQNLSAEDQILSGQPQFAYVYQADVNFTITDQNGYTNDFNEADTVNLKISGNGVALFFNGTKSDLVEWSENNREALMLALFGNAPESNFIGMTNLNAITQMLYTSVFTAPEQDGISFEPISTKDIILKSQFDFMKLGPRDYDGSGVSGLVSYDFKFGEKKEKSLGISAPFRQMSIDDGLDSKYQYVGFVPYFKHRWYMDRSVVEVIANLIIDATYFESDVFTDGGGFLGYGGGAGIKYAYAVSPGFSINCGLLYQGLDRYIYDDFVPDEMVWLADAVNDLPDEHDLSVNLSMLYQIIPGKFSFRGDVFRIHQLQSDVVSGYKNQTVAAGVFSYAFYKRSKISLGYKRSFEIEDVTDQSVILDLKISW